MNTINTPFYEYDFKNHLTKRIESNRSDREFELSYYNPVSKKWGTQKPKLASIQKWVNNGSKIKYLYVPKKLSHRRIERTNKINFLYNLIDVTADSNAIKTVLHIIFTRSFYSDEYGYSPIYCRKFSDLIGQKYSSVIEYCKRFKWIESNDFFKFNSQESYCKSYRISNKLLPNDITFKFRKTPLNDVKITNKFQLREQSFNDFKTLKETHKILAEIVKSAKIDLEGFKSEIENNPVLFKKRNLDLAFYLIEEINSGSISIKETVDTFGERFFSSFCNIIKETRKHIYFTSKEDKLVETDIANSQMYFFSLLADKKFFKEILFDNTFDVEEKAKFKYLHSELVKVKNNTDFIQFCEDAAEGIVYDTLAKNIIGWDRNKAKEMMLKVLFAQKGQYKNAKIKIRKIYSSVIDVIETVAFGINSTTVSMACQRAESTMLLDRVCQKLYHEHNIKEFITVHDSVMVEKKHIETVSECIVNEFILLEVTPPKLK